MDKTFELYNQTIKIHFKEKSHSYWLEMVDHSKKRLTGVTTYLGIIDKPFLPRWYANTAVEFLREHIDYLRDGTMSTDDILRQASQEAERIRDEAGEAGKAIHEWVEGYIKAKINKDSSKIPEMPEDEKVIIGVNSFLDWVKENKVKFLWSERIVYSKEYGYVGMADIGAEIGGSKYLVDLKSGNYLGDEVRLQTAAYLQAIQEESKEKYDGRWALRISKENSKQYYKRMEKRTLKEIPEFQVFEARNLDREYGNLNDDFKGFIAALNLYNWKKKTEKLNRQ